MNTGKKEVCCGNRAHVYADTAEECKACCDCKSHCNFKEAALTNIWDAMLRERIAG